jgi:Tol biopolymer transport system component
MSCKRFAILLLLILASCAAPPAQPVFYFMEMGNIPSLGIAPRPEFSQPSSRFPLEMPPDCGFWSLNPSPVSTRFAVELACPFGTVTYLLDAHSGDFKALIDDPSLDTRFLAWHPDGRSIYLKAGTLTEPRITRIDLSTGWQRDLPISPFTYDLDVSPDGQSLLFALTPGLGYGSETWVSDANGRNARKLWADPLNIFGPARFSPDGQQVAFILAPDSQEMTPPGQLWLMDARGSNARLIGEAAAGRGFAPQWSPDGAWIAFVGRNQAGEAILSIYDMKNDQLLSEPFAPETAPAWDFDSAGVYFTAVENDTMNVMFYDLTARRVDVLASGACCAGWIR